MPPTDPFSHRKPADSPAPKRDGLTRRQLLTDIARGGVLATTAGVVGGPAHGFWSYPGVDGRLDIPPKADGTIRAVVFNCRRSTLRGVPAPFGDFAVDLKTTIEICRSFNADVISLSEVERAIRTYGVDQTRVIARAHRLIDTGGWGNNVSASTPVEAKT